MTSSPRAQASFDAERLAVALLMTAVDNGCTKLGMDNWVQEVVTGAIIVIAVALDRWRGRKAT
jgi:ribose/xylose/arabinose/galactoside ABC-type transport system permease subunit